MSLDRFIYGLFDFSFYYPVFMSYVWMVFMAGIDCRMFSRGAPYEQRLRLISDHLRWVSITNFSTLLGKSGVRIFSAPFATVLTLCR